MGTGPKLIKSMVSEESEDKRGNATQALNEADYYVVIALKKQVGPEGGNMELFSNMDDSLRHKLMETVIKLDIANANLN